MISDQQKVRLYDYFYIRYYVLSRLEHIGVGWNMLEHVHVEYARNVQALKRETSVVFGLMNSTKSSIQGQPDERVLDHGGTKIHLQIKDNMYSYKDNEQKKQREDNGFCFWSEAISWYLVLALLPSLILEFSLFLPLHSP